MDKKELKFNQKIYLRTSKGWEERRFITSLPLGNVAVYPVGEDWKQGITSGKFEVYKSELVATLEEIESNESDSKELDDLIDRVTTIKTQQIDDHHLLDDLIQYLLGAPGYSKDVLMLALNNWSKRYKERK